MPEAPSTDTHLRLVWPQWQGAGTASVRQLAPEFPLEVGRRGYAVGAAVLAAVLPPHDGPTAYVSVAMGDDGLAELDGIEAKAVVVEQLARALDVISQHQPARITTIGGECSTSVAPFAVLADRYGDDLAIIWIDSHPDVDTGDTGYSGYSGYHAMPSRRSPGTVTRRSRLCCLRRFRPSEWRWSGCMPGPRTPTPMSVDGVCRPSAPSS